MHATICDYLADTVQNAIEANASEIDVLLKETAGKVEAVIKDNGKGMDEKTLGRVWDPFYSEAGKHDKRRVGLGLPLLKQMVESTGGGLSLSSQPGLGTTLDFYFAADHLDAPPMGDIPWTLISLFNYGGDFELSFKHIVCGNEYRICRSELLEALGDLSDASSLVMGRDFLRDQEEDLRNQCAAAHGRQG